MNNHIPLKKVYFMPHGINVLLNPTAIIAWIVIMAIIIIPFSILVEVKEASLILVLIMVSLVYGAIMTMRSPRPFLTFEESGVISFSGGIFFKGEERVISVSDIDRIYKTTETTEIFYFIPIYTTETGLKLENTTGDQVEIPKHLFHNSTQYRDFKKNLLKSTGLKLEEKW